MSYLVNIWVFGWVLVLRSNFFKVIVVNFVNVYKLDNFFFVIDLFVWWFLLCNFYNNDFL